MKFFRFFPLFHALEAFPIASYCLFITNLLQFICP